MNVVMSGRGLLVEVQGTAEGAPFSREDLDKLLDLAAKGIAGFSNFLDVWNERSPLEWDSSDPEPVANMLCVLMSDFSSKVSGEVVRVDGGFHAVAAPKT